MWLSDLPFSLVATPLLSSNGLVTVQGLDTSNSVRCATHLPDQKSQNTIEKGKVCQSVNQSNG